MNMDAIELHPATGLRSLSCADSIRIRIAGFQQLLNARHITFDTFKDELDKF